MKITAYLAPVLVFLPMLAAVAGYLIGRSSKNGRDTFVQAVTIWTCLLAVLGVYLAATGKELAFAWEGFCGLGLHFKLDGFRSLYVLVASFMWMMTALFSKEYFAHYRNRNRYYFFNLMTLGATLGVMASDDLYTTFIFFEIMSFTSYTWVAHEENPKAMRAAQTYLAIAVGGGLVTLMGLFLLYNQFGTLSFEGLRAAAALVTDKSTLYVAGALTVFGFACKAGMFPVHVWLPKAHPVAPAPASALLSGVLTKSGIFGILVVCCNIFLHDKGFGNAIFLFGIVTMFIGALLAVFSVDLKRTLACSSMSQIGFILVGIGMQGLLGEENVLAVQGTVLHMLNHSVFKLGLFMAAGTVYMNLHRLNLNDVRGFGRKKPILNFVFLMGALGLMGFPFFSGFVSKSLLHESIVEYCEVLHEEGLSTVFYKICEWVFLITGGMTGAYMTKLYVCLFIEKNETRQAEYDAKKHYMTGKSAFALLGAAVLVPIMGMLPNLTMEKIAVFASEFMHGEAPAHAINFFSFENFKGAAISLAIAAAVYFLIIRRFLMAKNENGVKAYVNRWPAWADLEDSVYRPVLKGLVAVSYAGCYVLDHVTEWAAKGAMAVLGAVFAVMDNITEWLAHGLLAVLGTLVRALDECLDDTALLLRKTLFSRKARKNAHIPVGTRFTYRLGVGLNRFAAFLNRTLCRKNPITTDYTVTLAAVREEQQKVTGIISHSVSYGLLLLCMGLLAMVAYLLLA